MRHLKFLIPAVVAALIGSTALFAGLDEQKPRKATASQPYPGFQATPYQAAFNEDVFNKKCNCKRRFRPRLKKCLQKARVLKARAKRYKKGTKRFKRYKARARARAKKCFTKYKTRVNRCCRKCKAPGDGGAACRAECDSVRDSAIATCNSTFDPAQCGGNPTCEDAINAQKQSCIDSANTNHTTCTAGCG